MKVHILEAGYCRHPGYMVDTQTSWDLQRFASTVVLMEHPKQGFILFDTGYSEKFHEATRYFPEKFYALVTPVNVDKEHSALGQIEALGLRARDIRHVILSHFHADHVCGLSDFPQAQYIHVGQAFDQLKGLSRWKRAQASFLLSLFPTDFLSRSRCLDLDSFNVQGPSEISSFRSFDLFNDESIFVVDLPGHAEGHLGLYINDPQKPFFFVGDASWRTQSLKNGTLPSVVTALVHQNWSQFKNTFFRLSELVHRSPKISVVTCHCEDSLIEGFREKLI